MKQITYVAWLLNQLRGRPRRRTPHTMKAEILMATPSTPMIPVSTPRTLRRAGVMSTAEIKARIEAMYADDRRPGTPTVR
ncbi:hypothetical protein EEB14_54500 [Rhodococcus sp. WS4]|nr:hypothetical protein EEB14_54500 [Rhodococcus sp. WS4]